MSNVNVVYLCWVVPVSASQLPVVPLHHTPASNVTWILHLYMSDGEMANIAAWEMEIKMF